MSNENEIWAYENLEIDEDGHVREVAYTHPFKDGYDVQVAVTSYDFEKHGETKTNHVPNVVLTDEDGSIVAEPHARDSYSAEKAIENGKRTAEYVFKHPEQFI